MSFKLQTIETFIKRNICAILLFTVIGMCTYLVKFHRKGFELPSGLFTKTSQSIPTTRMRTPSGFFTNTSKSLPAARRRTPNSLFTNTSKSLPGARRIPKDFCTNTSGPSVYIICTWDIKKDLISRYILTSGKWEPLTTQMLYSVLKKDRKITFIDIGANIGYFSLLAASVGQSVISVEPWKRNVEKIQESIRKNKFEDRIIVLNNAIFNNRRVIHIHAPFENNLGATRVLSDPSVTGPNVFSADSITLNDVANHINTKDVVIKMDIEGNECRALEKSELIFEKFNVLFICMEWNVMKMFQNNADTACPPKNIKQMVEMLAMRDFVPYSSYKVFPLNPLEYKNWTDANIYWIPKKRVLL